MNTRPASVLNEYSVLINNFKYHCIILDLQYILNLPFKYFMIDCSQHSKCNCLEQELYDSPLYILVTRYLLESVLVIFLSCLLVDSCVIFA